MILILMRVLLIATDGSGRPKEFIDQAIRLQGFRLYQVLLPIKIELRDLLLDLRQVLVGERECNTPALHFDNLLFDQGVFKEILLVLLELPHGDFVAVKGVVLGHLGHLHLQVEGALS
jgi:hypothetical protein